MRFGSDALVAALLFLACGGDQVQPDTALWAGRQAYPAPHQKGA